MSKLQTPTPAQIARATKYKLLGETSCEECQFCYVEAADINERTSGDIAWNVRVFNMFCALNSNPCADRFSGVNVTFRYDSEDRFRITDTPELHHRCPRYLGRANSIPVPIFGVGSDWKHPTLSLVAKADRAIKDHRKRRRNRQRASDERGEDSQDG